MKAWWPRIVAALLLGGTLGWVLASSAPGAVMGALAGPLMLVVLARRREAARAAVERQDLVIALPDALELLASAVEGGASPDVALLRVADFAPPRLGGLLRAAAHRAGATGLGTAVRAADPTLRPLGSLLQQSEELGVPVAGALRLLASDARLRARSEAKERAAAAAPKMMLVVGGLLAPAALLIVVGGQALVLRDLIGPVLA